MARGRRDLCHQQLAAEDSDKRRRKLAETGSYDDVTAEVISNVIRPGLYSLHPGVAGTGVILVLSWGLARLPAQDNNCQAVCKQAASRLASNCSRCV